MSNFTTAPAAAPVVATPTLATSAQLLALPEDHPVKANFLKFCGANAPTKRQATKFFAKFPALRANLVS